MLYLRPVSPLCNNLTVIITLFVLPFLQILTILVIDCFKDWGQSHSAVKMNSEYSGMPPGSLRKYHIVYRICSLYPSVYGQTKSSVKLKSSDGD